MIGTIVAVDIASKTFLDTKFRSVFCQPVVSAASSSRVGSTAPSKTIPLPGPISTLSPHARTAATTENPIIHLNVRNAICRSRLPTSTPSPRSPTREPKARWTSG
ncbi:hypothetical protein SAMN04488548_1341636 [Gordonia westfalica]|uniref:Uncharacterized protein n=1 Tax=Gordonia westfalica TaxID=158898 RepID=A0A1H2J1F5_9ACTN|nr:hypothetical protein SAMN04488548_1341636 [Gordonia westfalica]